MTPGRSDADEQRTGGEVALRQEQHPKRWRVVSEGGGREQRRRDALRRQREARRDLTDRVRDLVLEAMTKDDDEEEDEKGGQQQAAGVDDGMMAVEQQAEAEAQTQAQDGQRQRRRRRRLQNAELFGSQLCIPEWMVEVPPDLNGKDEAAEEGGGWLVMARPAGKRCLLVASCGQTVSRLRNGDVLHRFDSALPNGGPHSPGPQNGWTLLDCIYHEADRTYYILDLLCWRNMELYDCTAEFRLFFLRSKFEEELEPRGAALCADAGAPDPWPHRMRPLLYYDCDPAGLRRAYVGFTPFLRDGLLFAHKQGYYGLGLTPLVLLWKDAVTSRYLTAHRLSCVLAVRRRPSPSPSPDGGELLYELATLDGHVVGGASAAEVEGAWGLKEEEEEQQGQEQGQGQGQGQGQQRLARFSYDAAGEQAAVTADGSSVPVPVPVVEGLRFEKACSPSRAPVADPWSKILFNSRVRQCAPQSVQDEGNRAVTFDHLLAVAEAPIAGDGMQG